MELRKEDIERFWSKVDVGEPDACWNWRAGGSRGYGTFYPRSVPMAAHRFAFWARTGIYPGEFEICHSCDNKLCCNPAHLFMGTHFDNMDDAARKSHMPHKLTIAEVREIRARYAGMSQQQLAAEYGVGQMHISNIVNRKIWKHVE